MPIPIPDLSFVLLQFTGNLSSYNYKRIFTLFDTAFYFRTLNAILEGSLPEILNNLERENPIAPDKSSSIIAKFRAFDVEGK